jgi:fructuronate reductase
VTEKGYCHDPATGCLNFDHPDIVHDLAHPATPRSAVGMVVAGLARRREARGGPLNVICCDNLPHNGRVLEGLVQAYAERHDAALGEWIAQHAAFPCTMVDRIVPATTAADIDEVSRRLGVDDLAPVMTEPFSSWVIENRFAASRPAWEEAGALVVSDVAPFEEMKLRMLNGSHSTLAYLGFLMGHEFVWQASADPLLGELIGRQMAEEIAPTLVVPPGANPRAYAAQLLRRFRNPALPHRTQQIAMDGSQKLPQRLLGTVRDRISKSASFAHLALAVAAWIRYASGRDEQGKTIAVSDPLASRFAAIAAAAAGDASRVADGFLDLAPVFGDLTTHSQFRAKVRESVQRLFRDGARATVAAHLGRA